MLQRNTTSYGNTIGSGFSSTAANLKNISQSQNNGLKVEAQVLNQALHKASGVTARVDAAVGELINDPIDFAVEADRSLDSRIQRVKNRVHDLRDNVAAAKKSKKQRTKHTLLGPLQLLADVLLSPEDDFEDEPPRYNNIQDYS